MDEYEISRSLDDYQPLGPSGLLVSSLALGAMTFGESWGFGCDKETSHLILDHYLELGGNFIDTSNMYTNGESESILGDYFKVKGSRARDLSVITTKFGANMISGNPNSGGSGRKSIISSCESSLKRLKVDSIDLYWVHFWDKLTPIEEVLETLDLLIKQGKIKYIGFSDHPAWVCSKAIEFTKNNNLTAPIALQIEYNLLERSVEGELIPMAREYGLGIVPWSPLRGGLLSGKYRRNTMPQFDNVRKRKEEKDFNEKTWLLIDLLDQVAKENNASIPQVSIAWILHKKGITAPIIGARTLEQLKENIKSVVLKLDRKTISKIDKATVPILPFPCDFLNWVQNFIHGGATVCGKKTDRPQYLK